MTQLQKARQEIAEGHERNDIRIKQVIGFPMLTSIIFTSADRWDIYYPDGRIETIFPNAPTSDSNGGS